ncbi:hypothetical protein K449DRAFT_396212 [Hypoxylon sp. EC38]|nr:hypothetical protein K449DRAFT_396212 [Hypoxylon sp. EC38]
MADQDRSEIIRNNPIGESLDAFLVLFNSLCKANHISCSDAILNELSDEDIKGLISGFLLMLQNLPAARLLRSRTRGLLRSDLLRLDLSLDSDDLDFKRIQPLLRAIINKKSDEEIWTQVYHAVAEPTPSTPPSNRPPTYNGTAVKASSSRLANSEIRSVVEGELFYEIKDCTFRDVKEQKKMLEVLMAEHDGSKWATFPSIPDESSIWSWLRSLEDCTLADAPYKLYTTYGHNQSKEWKAQVDIFFQVPHTVSSDNYEYKDVLVVGEQKETDDPGRVFTEQPTRRFVHAFTLCASTMELWVFDRSGAYSSGPFDIHKEPNKFASAIVGYATMDKDAMGLDTFIEQKNGGNQIVSQRAVVCRGTTCFEARNTHESQKSYVAKFSWVSDKRKPEAEQLKLAAERGVQGVARVVAHRQITTIRELREGLEFRERHRFQDDGDHFDNWPSATATNTSGRKQKSSSHYASGISGSKRWRSNSQESELTQNPDSKLLINKPKPSLYNHGEDLWENRIYSCLIISPVGRVINDFNTISELLQAIRDAIKAHQSLYKTGRILHRDISSNNIIITKPDTADGFKGMLIDLDLAKVKDTGPSGTRHQTGTVQFMAVEVLRKVDHTYRHDLESFFYVLIWMCARQSWNKGFTGVKGAPRNCPLRRWEIGTPGDIAHAKQADMTVNGLEGIMQRFPDAFQLDVIKKLCLAIRKRYSSPWIRRTE